jgi:uncharacterized protein YbaP (TraB family)
MKKISLAVLSALTIVFLIGLEASSAQTKKGASNQGLLYKISGKNLSKPSYLFGTIHIICPTDMFSAEKLNGYIDQTDQLIMELDMDDAAEMKAMGTGMAMPDGKTLSDLLTPAQYAKVDEMFKNHMGVSVDRLKNFKPFMLQVLIATNPKALGCSPPASYETTFLKAATDRKKSIEGLETVSSQFAAMNKNPLEKQAKALYEMSLNPQKSFDDFRKLVEVYKTQNSDSLYQIINGQLGGERAFQTALLDDRNRAWIPKIEKAIKEKPAFIAVGGGHLGGKNGILRLLKARGYQIQAIRL